MKRNRFFFLLFLAPMAWAQTTTAKLAPIRTDGLHRIFLPAEISSYSELTMADFRIYDSKGRQVPYQFPSGTYDGIISHFTHYKIISSEIIPKKSTSITVEIPKPGINDITIHVGNAEVRKKFSISGSNDGRQWFGLVNQRELYEIIDDASFANNKIITLPRNNYRYIRFDIDDKKTLPLNIMGIGDVQVVKIPQRKEDIKPAKLTFTENARRKTTLVHVQFDHEQTITEFQFNVTAPNHYYRDVTQFKNVPYRYKKKDGLRQVVIDTFSLSSQHDNFTCLPFREKDFYFEIDNRDNPPLTIDGIRFSQRLLWIVADLKANEPYRIETGNPKLSKPDYDMRLSESKLRDSMPEAKITDIRHAVAQSGKQQKKPQSMWQRPWFLWMCILIGALVVLYFTVSLVKDMKKS